MKYTFLNHVFLKIIMDRESITISILSKRCMFLTRKIPLLLTIYTHLNIYIFIKHAHAFLDKINLCD